MPIRVAAGGGFTPVPNVPISAMAVKKITVLTAAPALFVGSPVKMSADHTTVTLATNTAAGVTGAVLALYDAKGCSVHSRPASAVGYSALITTDPSLKFLVVMPTWVVANNGLGSVFSAESSVASENPIRGDRGSAIVAGASAAVAATTPLLVIDKYGVETAPTTVTAPRPVVIVSLNPLSVVA